MIVRFCLYSVLKNLRFFEPFFVLYLLVEPEHGGVGLDFLRIGTLVGWQKLVTGLLEIPTGVATDRWGRRRALAACFAGYTVAFPLYAVSAGVDGGARLAILFAAQTLFGVAEALRTGSHKAIMLDWLDATGRGDEATRVVGRTRFFSKASAGISALLGGILVWRTGAFAPLFLAATVPAGLGVALMLSYPRWLEGETVRRRGRVKPPGARESFRRLAATPGLVFLVAQSILLESQVKLAQHYLQPFLHSGLRSLDVTVVGGLGALGIGLYYFVQDGLGGVASASAGRIERRLGGGFPATQKLYGAAVALLGLLALSLRTSWAAIGVMGFVALAFLQNARRPIFVAQLNRVMDKPQRATTLSIESQVRNWTVAALAPATGWAADRFGLASAFGILAAILIIGGGLFALPRGRLGRPEAETGRGNDRAT